MHVECSFTDTSWSNDRINPFLAKSPSLWMLCAQRSILAVHSLWPLTDSKCQQSQPKSAHRIHLCSSLQTKSDTASKWLGSKHNPQRQSIWMKQVPNTLQMTIDFAAITQANPSFTSAQEESTSTLNMGHFKKLGIISLGHSVLPNVIPHGWR